MSVFGALSTAVSGLSAQAHAFTDISNNISNSQTIGYKAADTNFSDYVLTAADAEGTNGTVRAATAYENESQGTITSSTNALALAISGRGYFSVDEQSGDSTGSTTAFQDTNYYTRNGNFTENNQGYLVNSSNEYLKGYMVANGSLSTTLQPINVSNVTFTPVPTGTVTCAASLPGSAVTAADPTAENSTTIVYDSQGQAHNLALNWTRVSGTTTEWTVNANVYNSAGTSVDSTASAQVTFDSNGKMSAIAPGSGTTGTSTNVIGSTASFTIPATSGGAGAITVNLGRIGSSTGTTAATDTTATGNAASVTADGAATGVYQGITMTSDGNIMATFDNNQSQLIGKVPLAMFADPNALLSQDGEAFTATSASGAASLTLSGENGSGQLETSSIENSTTSLDTDLTKLITAQQAYGANAKIVTTANEMLQTVLAMKQ